MSSKTPKIGAFTLRFRYPMNLEPYNSKKVPFSIGNKG